MKPMKSVAYELEKVVFPVYGAFKLDGYRCVGVDGKAKTNSLKDFRNKFVQFCLGGFSQLNGLDGELIVGPPNAPNVFNTSTILMATDSQPNFKFFVFDDFSRPDDPYEVRLTTLRRRAREFNEVSDSSRVVVLEQRLINNAAELELFEQEALSLGYEGIMIRRPDGKYKFGRSTVKEGYLLKVKRFSHGEGTIVGFKERMHNENDAFENELGHITRSSSLEGLVGAGMMGALELKHPDYDGTFFVGCGTMTHEESLWAWENRESLRGLVSRFKWFPHGTKDKPRHGMYAGLRDNDDLGEDHPLYREAHK